MENKKYSLKFLIAGLFFSTILSSCCCCNKEDSCGTKPISQETVCVYKPRCQPLLHKNVVNLDDRPDYYEPF